MPWSMRILNITKDLTNEVVSVEVEAKRSDDSIHKASYGFGLSFDQIRQEMVGSGQVPALRAIRKLIAQQVKLMREEHERPSQVPVQGNVDLLQGQTITETP